MAHTSPHTSSAAVIAGRPISAILTQFPVVCFTLTLLTDIAYWQTSNLMWLEFSCWLLLVGLVFGVLALIAGVFEFVFRSKVRALTWPYAAGGTLVLALALLNNFVHAADGWTAVVPWGLIISLATVIVMIVTHWFGRAAGLRSDVRVSRYD